VRTALVLAAIITTPACSVDSESDPGPAPIFGDSPGPCGVTVLTNGIGDEEKLRAGVDCAITEADARSDFTWDLLVPTVEGDPILYRFSGDGEQVTITMDTTRDAFGSPSVLVQECATIDDTGFVPIGVDCVDTSGIAFELPSSVWPP
jgi:hypothetical protein